MKNILNKKGSNKLVSAFATFLLLSGAGYILLPSLQDFTAQRAGVQINERIIDDADTLPDSRKVFALGTPTSLSLPRLGINLGIKNGYYNSNRQEWTIDKVNTFSMVGSKTPLIYGHNNNNIFGKLTDTAKDELLIVSNEEGKELLFKYESDSILKPNESGIIGEYSDNTVYLMTCSGTFNEFRRLLTFVYVGEAANLKNARVTTL